MKKVILSFSLLIAATGLIAPNKSAAATAAKQPSSVVATAKEQSNNIPCTVIALQPAADPGMVYVVTRDVEGNVYTSNDAVRESDVHIGDDGEVDPNPQPNPQGFIWVLVIIGIFCLLSTCNSGPKH